MKKKRYPTIGWREWVALPHLGVHAVKAKVDTGARTSSLHAFDVAIHRRRGGDVVTFKVHPIQRETDTTVSCEEPLFDERWVTSSNGRRELRPVIRTQLSLLDKTWPIEVTLTSRDIMGFRMLLGREAIRARFLVDPGRSYLASDRHKTRRIKK
jgi:hypothetical protein